MVDIPSVNDLRPPSRKQAPSVVPGGPDIAETPSIIPSVNDLRPRPTQDAGKVIDNVVPINPAAQAEINSLAQQTGTAPGIIQENPQAVRDQLRAEQIRNEIADAPVTQRFMSDPARAAIAHDDVETLSSMERVFRGFERGRLTHQLGLAGAQLRDTKDPGAAALVAELEADLAELGEDEGGGFTSFLSSAANILGLQFESFTQPEAAVLIGGGGALGAVAGLAGGPLAPATSTVGAVSGMTAGALSHIIIDSFKEEGGHSYLELKREGISDETATVLSIGVGTINAALEVGAAAVVLKPLGDAGKALVKDGIKEATKRLTKSQVVAQAATAYAGGIAAETFTEGVQETVNISAEELGKALEGIDSDTTAEEVADRITGIMEETFKGMVVLGLPGPVANASVQIREARRAKRNQLAIDRMVELAQQSSVQQRDPEAMAEHITDVLEEGKVEDVYVSADQLLEWAEQAENPQEVLNNLGVAKQIDEARILGTDVRITSDRFARHIMQSENYEALSPHLRYNEDGFTAQEAQEFEDTGLQEALQQASVDAVQDDPAVQVAENEFGMQAFFETAEEAGMTEKQYEQYLQDFARGKDQTRQNQDDAWLRQQQREIEAEIKADREDITPAIRETISQKPVYQAFHGISVDRLDRNMVQEILSEIDVDIKSLPRQGRRTIYTTQKGEVGLDPNAYAELYGYNDAVEMFEDMLTSPSFTSAVQTEVDKQLAVKHGDLRNKHEEIIQARRSLHNDQVSIALTTELNALRKAQGEKAIPKRLLKRAAKQHLGTLPIKDISSRRFFAAEKRESRKARSEFRKGNISEATPAKFKQLMNFEMAKAAERVRNKVEKQRSFLNKIQKPKKKGNKLPVKYQDAINSLLENVRFKPRISQKKLDKIKAAVEDQVEPIHIRDKFLDEANKINYLDLSLSEFTEVHDYVKNLEKIGRTENKFRLEREKRTVKEIVEQIVDLVRTNLKNLTPQDVTEQRGRWDKLKGFRELTSLLFNTDTILREIDGFQDFGPAYEAIKGRYDRALADGYRNDQRGYLRRKEEAALEITKLYDIFDKKTKNDINKKISIPGVSGRRSHHTVLSVLLNSGNEGNLQALIDSKTFTEPEIRAIHDYATETDWKFAQSVWDYLETYWPEVKATEQRRRNYTPEQVEATPIQTKFGEFRGGYYPIRYDKKQGFYTTPEEAQQLVDNVKFGSHASSQTARGHTEQRQDSQGHKLLLDLFVINAHVDQVIYDLEVGDAIRDMYAVVHHPELVKAFADVGQRYKHDQLDVWLRDAIQQETGINNALEKSLRWLRTGFTVSKLGWNLGTIALQPLGLTQSAVLIGRKNMWHGTRLFFKSPWFGEKSVFKFIAEQSGFMAGRQEQFNKDIQDARDQLGSSITSKILPGKTGRVIKDSFFAGIIKAQRMVDAITWLGALKQGQEQFGGDHQKAVRHADRIVARAQASGIFAERTPLERGSLTSEVRQSEFIRAFTPLISYFMAKMNITIERTKRTDFTKLSDVITWSWDMMLLYTIEALLAGLIRGQWPEEDDETTFIEYTAVESINTLAAGVPIIREAVSGAQGFSTGGILGSVFDATSRAFNQAEQGEIDAALLKSLNNVGGIFFRYPASQINKTAEAIASDAEGEDVEAIEFLMGRDFTE